MKGFSVISPALEKEVSILYVDDAISLAVQLALAFREQTRVFANAQDKSTIIALINGEQIKDYQLKSKEKVITQGGPEKRT